MILIADSGSTKTAWCAVVAPALTLEFQTSGINPVRDDEADMYDVVLRARAALDVACVQGGVASGAVSCVEALYFYGAGCLPAFIAPLQQVLSRVFPSADIIVESDLLGAARALCGHEEGIACILGTGANSCLYDGEAIVQHTPALGWILGDEGSGAVLGSRLVGDVLKRQLPKHLCEAFLLRFGLTADSIIEAVYRQPQPNRFLASLVPFLAEYAAEPAIRAFLVTEFRRFLVRNVSAYGRADLPVNFVGGIAAHFSEMLAEAAVDEGFKLGRVENSPIRCMAAFHSTY